MSRIFIPHTARHLITFLLLLAFMLSTNPGVQAYVWCVKQEGSSALSASAHKSHSPSGIAAAVVHEPACSTPQYSNSLTCGFSCVSCIDIPVEAEFSTQSQYQLKKIPSQAQAPQWHELQWLYDSTTALTCTQLPQPPPCISSTIDVQRTIVLLI